MLVRSPTLTNSESSVMFSGSRPGQPQRRRELAGLARRVPGDGLAIAAMWSGVVPQQPPTMLTRPARRTRRAISAVSSGGLVVLAEGVGQAGVGVAETKQSATRESSARYGPHLLGAERAVEPDQRAAGRGGPSSRTPRWSGPDSVRPEASVIVPETMTGQRRPRSSNSVSRAKIAALAFSVSKIVSTRSRSAPPSTQAAGRLARRPSTSCVEGDVAGAGVVDVGRDRRGAGGRAEGAGDVPRAVGGARRHRVGLAPGQPRGLEVHLVGEVLHAVVGQGDRVGVERVGLDDVGAGLEVLAVDVAR